MNKDVRSFADQLTTDSKLATDFAKAIQKVAKKAGYDLDIQDIRETFIDNQPVTRPLPIADENEATTMAVGEEDGCPAPRTTMAIGEEGKPPSTATTLAVGEENTRPGVTSTAIGEEGGKPNPPMTTKAIGEEGKPPPTATTLAVGEESGKIKPPPMTTKAIGEEGKGWPKPKAPKP